MTSEYQTEIKKSDERWHADKTDIGGGIVSAGLLVAGHFWGGAFTAFAPILALAGLAALRSKAENAARFKTQNNPS